MVDESNSLSILFGGDVGPTTQPVDRLPALIEPLLERADFRFAQCERTYSNRGYYPEWSTIPGGRHTRLDPQFADVFRTAKIDIVSVASNHAMDWGWEPLEDTIEQFRGWGMQVVGGGYGQAEAHRPAIVELNGVKVAILAYCSAVREGQVAIKDVPGIAALRAHTAYEPVDFQAGSPPLIRSWAYGDDVAAAAADIQAAKQVADAVVVSIHWGIRHVPKVLAEYQQPMGHALLDAGADVIIGHHPHTPKSIEIYNGKLCFYSIGNFLSTGQSMTHREGSVPRWNVYWSESAPADSLYAFPEHCRDAIVPILTFGKQGLMSARAVPVRMNNLAQPEIVTADMPEFKQALEHLEWVSDQHQHSFAIDGDEFVIGTSAA